MDNVIANIYIIHRGVTSVVLCADCVQICAGCAQTRIQFNVFGLASRLTRCMYTVYNKVSFLWYYRDSNY